MYIQFPVIFIFPLTVFCQSDVFTDSIQEYTLEENTSLRGFHLRDKYSSGSMARLRRPILRLGKCEHSGPRRKGRYDFERFRQGT